MCVLSLIENILCCTLQISTSVPQTRQHMAVNNSVWTTLVPSPVPADRDTYWEQMARLAQVWNHKHTASLGNASSNTVLCSICGDSGFNMMYDIYSKQPRPEPMQTFLVNFKGSPAMRVLDMLYI